MSIGTGVTCTLDFPNGISQSFVKQFSSNGGSISWNKQQVMMQAGTAADSVSSVSNMMLIRLQDFEFTELTINSKFDTPTVGSRQLTGLGDMSRGIFFGFIDTQFGLLVVRGGSRHYWSLKITSGTTSPGLITMVLMDRTFYFPVPPSLNHWQVMLYIAFSSQISDANIQFSIDADQVEFYTIYPINGESYSVINSIDFSSTGVVGSLSTTTAGILPTETWVPDSQFSEIGYQSISQVHNYQNMNVYRFRFSRWSSGSIVLSMMNPFNSDLTPIHTYVPGVNLFETSVPYKPSLAVYKTGITEGPITSSFSMGNISSGTPSTAGLKSRFNTNFMQSNLRLFTNTETVVGIISNPMVQDGNNNFMVVSLIDIRINLICSKAVMFKMFYSAICVGTFTCTRHISWSSVNHTTGPVDAVALGGLEVMSFLMPDTIAEKVLELDQLWLPPGNVLVFTISPLNEPVKVQSVSFAVSWYES